jgi:hypothetical protein
VSVVGGLLSVVKNKVSGVSPAAGGRSDRVTGLYEKKISIKIKAEFKDVN